ncbi:transcriptional regulator, AraC family (plasmid) [Paracoccus aminophilus JCM 7686]|uniref:Transcriptional regulator, AraC family n=1 Tax=Paracoccus aminophilus JCM 7686 TaxID=1367847 RepID=S5YHQ2_PARAH|nr:transcriptional regulator, AraC family [Paracoccus aminophilus JCM 7686]
MPASLATGPTAPISAYLAASPHAELRGGLDLGFGRSVKLWRNRDAFVRYDAPAGHTLSFYSKGGAGTRRLDTPGGPARGWQGAVCMMPEGLSSEWEITESFEFVHINLPDDELRLAYAETFDRDARAVDVADLTYADAQGMAAPFLALQAAALSGQAIWAEEAATELLAALFSESRFVARCTGRLAGGLSPKSLGRIREFIEANLDQPLHLRDLAGLVGLSEFHFQRSFRASVGVTPHRLIQHRRIQRAKALIGAGEPLAQAAAACGFDSQSHLSRAFKAATGLTPGRYRLDLRPS